MIQLKDIQIKFRETIIEQGGITLQKHQITLFTGISGCGKSSLLNILGLLDNQNHFQYLWDDKEINSNECEKLKQYEIAYVFQDYSIRADIDIEDNFKAMFQIAGLPFQKERMQELLKEVSLESLSVKQKAKSLSGGERQRLAIALALVKQPKLLLLDEPTANLDEASSDIIVNILHQIKQQDIMIAIATHHPNRYHADHIYEIKDKKIVETRKTEASQEASETKKEIRKRFKYLAYARLHFVSHFIIYAIILAAMCFSFYEVSKGMVNIFGTKQFMDERLGEIISDELIVNHIEELIVDDDKYYFQSYLHSFTKEQVDEISKIPHVKSIYPYTVLVDSDFIKLEADGTLTSNYESFNQNGAFYNNVRYGSKTINILDEYSDNLLFASCDKDVKKRQSIKVDESVESGVFISKDLADELGIKKLNHTEIEVYMPIHMGYTTSKGGTSDGKVEVVTNPVISLFKKTKLPIQGIYEKDIYTQGYYDILSNEKIFIDYRTVEQYHKEAINNHELLINFKDIVTANLFDYDRFYVNDTSSMYIIQVDDPKYTEEVTEQIYKTLDNVYVKNKDTEKESLYGSLNEVAMTSLMMPAILFIVTAVLMMILYLYTLHARKKEIAYLQANGITKTHKIPFINQMMVIMPSGMIGFIMTYVWANGYSDYSILCKVMVFIIAAVVLLLVLYHIISYCYFKRLDVRKELHSN